MKKQVLTCLMAMGLMSSQVEAALELHGKIDAGPAYVHLDDLENKKKLNSVDMWGGQLSTVTAVWEGLCIKTGSLWVAGDHSELVMNSAALGFYFPIGDYFGLMPWGGYGISHYRTHIDVPLLGITIPDVLWTANSHTPQAGLDIYVKPTDWLRLSGTVSYGWARNSTYLRAVDAFKESFGDEPGADQVIPHLKKVQSKKQRSSGFNYVAVIEYLINDSWSVNLAGAWYESFTKETFGSRAKGASLRLGYRY